MSLTMKEAVALYRHGNNSGAGWDPGGDTVDEALVELDAELILARHTTDDVAVVFDSDSLIAIGGTAGGRAPWAVTIVDLARVAKLGTEAFGAGDERAQALCSRAARGYSEAFEAIASILAAGLG